MPDLNGSKTHDNLKEAFAGESQANRRYLYFAQKADVEGYPDVAALFRSVAEGETGHAFGHFDFLAEVGDPVTGVPVGATTDNLQVGGRRRDLRVHRDVPGLRHAPRATKASKRSRSGSRRSPAPRRATPVASSRASSPSPDDRRRRCRSMRRGPGARPRGRSRSRTATRSKVRWPCTSTTRSSPTSTTPTRRAPNAIARSTSAATAASA